MKKILADIQSGKFAKEWMDGAPRRPAPLPRAAQRSRDAPGRRGRREAARHDAVARLGSRWSIASEELTDAMAMRIVDVSQPSDSAIRQFACASAERPDRTRRTAMTTR